MNEPQESKAPLAGLARTIELRGGQADPEATMVIEHREALIYLLCEAAELEHSIMCEYLFAAFSLKQHSDEGLTDDELSAVKRWRRAISHVASQEMLHLALVHNLLSAIGAAPHLARPNLPQPARHYPAGVQLALMPFGEPARGVPAAVLILRARILCGGVRRHSPEPGARRRRRSGLVSG